MNENVKGIMVTAVNAVLFPVSCIEYHGFDSVKELMHWYINQDLLGPFLYTQVSSAVEALEETGIQASFYAPIISDVESFFEMMFC